MPKLKIKKGDHVVVITGKDKGKKGEVLKVMPEENRAIVKGVAMVRRHQRQTAAQDGGIICKGDARVNDVGHAHPREVPRLDKVVLNMGVGEGINDSKKVTAAAADLGLIAGQKPVITRARKAGAPFT